MSESILKALMQMFALIVDVSDGEGISGKSKDIVRLFLTRHLNSELVNMYMEIFEEYLLSFNSESITRGSLKEKKRTSLTAMRILAICEKINEELHQNQKVYVIVQVMDFILFNAQITEKELDFLSTVSAAFNIPLSDFLNIESFILGSYSNVPDKNRVMIMDNKHECSLKGAKHLFKENLRGVISFLYIEITNTFILRYAGREDLILNGQIIMPEQTYIFDNGSTIRGPGINTIYYNDVCMVLTEKAFKQKISISATNISYRFKNSENGIHQLSFHEESGTLVGIMGGSGVGKSTLLNILCGASEPELGEVLINGYNLYSDKDKESLKGVIGFVPQDDLLNEDLTVYQNLCFTARLCLNDFQEEMLIETVNSTLKKLDLYEIRNLKVGSTLNKIISGGQRKRLNIALELIREPTILFVDEPTSGLSSVDSEMVMLLLKELTYSGKMVIINIHQPGSDIYKMFDKIMVLDKFGYQIFYGNPTEAIVYFKTKSSHANADEDRCTSCGNVDPDQILKIVEAKVVNEFGKPTHIRKVSPEEWAERFKEVNSYNNPESFNKRQEIPENYYSIPGLLKQTRIFFIRDVLSKLANRQYVLLSLLGAPLLAFLLAWFTRYSSGSEYIFSENRNLPAYLFMSVITSIFLGLIISAEEIVRERKILKRESFLNLSWFSYLNSKIMIMFLVSAIQTLSFILVGNYIFKINGMLLPFWIVLFSTSCFANMLGLNISAAFNSVKTIYILIPFIIIPQLLFSGVLVDYDKLNRSSNSSYEFVPVIGDIMAARWSFEALAVEQFKNNKYDRNYFKYNMEISQNDWYANFLLPDLNIMLYGWKVYKDSILYREDLLDNYKKLNYYIEKLSSEAGPGYIPGEWKASLNEDSFNMEAANQTEEYLDSLKNHFIDVRKKNIKLKDSVSISLLNKIGIEGFKKLKSSNHNYSLEDLVTTSEINKETKDRIIQRYKPIYMKPVSKNGRAHYYAPYKQIGNTRLDTFWFNVLVLWLVTISLYATLYYSLFKKAVSLFIFIRSAFIRKRYPVLH
jgi:ABC transport system ATP-binding/permease protein